MQPKICMYIFVIQMKTKKERMETASKIKSYFAGIVKTHPSLSGMDVIVNRKKCVFALVISMDGNALIL